MLMRKTFTSYLVALFTLLVTTIPASADNTQNADRDKINSIVLSMLNQWDQTAFQGAANLISGVAKFDMTNVAIEGVARLVGIKSAIEGSTDYRLLFHGKMFTGHFVVQDGVWVKESDADDLQFTYTDANGKACVLRLATSGATKTTELPYTEIMSLVNGFLGGDDDDDDDYDYSRRAEEDDASMMDAVSAILQSFLEDVTQVQFEVPATTTIDLTYGGSPVVTSAINVDLNKLGTSLFGGFIASANTKFYKGVMDGGTPGSYEFNVTNSGYYPGTGIVVDLSAKKDNANPVSFKVNLPGTFKGLDVNAYMTQEGIDLGFTALNVEIDVKGEAQLKGGITDLNAFINLLVAAESSAARRSEGMDSELLAQLNQMVNVNLYYDGSSTPAASLKLLPSYDEDWDEWTIDPCIVFASDNSQYKLDEFFTVENFPEVAQGVMAIVSDISQLVENVKDTAEEKVQKVNTINRQSQTATEWYTLDGKRTTGAAKGLKIVRMSDGTVRKVMTK